MRTYTLILLAVWFVTLAVGAALSILHIFRDWRKGLLGLAMTVFIPFVGTVMCIILFIRFERGRYAMSTEETIRVIKIKESAFVDEERAMNAVPSVDALSISNTRQRRTYLLGLLRQYELDALRNVFRQALRNSDSEASHYAAAALMELQRQSFNAMAEAGILFEQNPLDYDVACSYAGLIHEYLANSEAGNMESAELQRRYEQVLLHILNELGEHATGEDHEALVVFYLRRRNTSAAAHWANAYISAYPREECGYLLLMEAAYQDGDAAAFEGALSRLRERNDLSLSQDGLTSVRFWLQGKRPPPPEPVEVVT